MNFLSLYCKQINVRLPRTLIDTFCIESWLHYLQCTRDFNYEPQCHRTIHYTACTCVREGDLNKTQRPLSLWLLWDSAQKHQGLACESDGCERERKGCRVQIYTHAQLERCYNMCLRYTSIIKRRSTQQLHQNVNYSVTVKCISTVTLMVWNYSMCVCSRYVFSAHPEWERVTLLAVSREATYVYLSSSELLFFQSLQHISILSWFTAGCKTFKANFVCAEREKAFSLENSYFPAVGIDKKINSNFIP